MSEEGVLAVSLIAALAVLPGLFLKRRKPPGFLPRAALGGGLLFLVWAVMRQGFVPVGVVLEQFRDDMADLGEVVSNAGMLLGALLLGFLLPYWQARVWTGNGAPVSPPPARPVGGSIATMPTVAFAVGVRHTVRRVDHMAIGIGLSGALAALAIGSYGDDKQTALTIVLALGVGLQALVAGMDLGAARPTNAPTGSGGLVARVALLAAAPVFGAAVLGTFLSDELAQIGLSGLAAGALLHIVARSMANISRMAAPAMYLGVISGLWSGLMLYVVIIGLWGSEE